MSDSSGDSRVFTGCLESNGLKWFKSIKRSRVCGLCTYGEDLAVCGDFFCFLHLDTGEPEWFAGVTTDLNNLCCCEDFIVACGSRSFIKITPEEITELETTFSNEYYMDYFYYYYYSYYSIRRICFSEDGFFAAGKVRRIISSKKTLSCCFIGFLLSDFWPLWLINISGKRNIEFSDCCCDEKKAYVCGSIYFAGRKEHYIYAVSVDKNCELVWSRVYTICNRVIGVSCDDKYVYIMGDNHYSDDNFILTVSKDNGELIDVKVIEHSEVIFPECIKVMSKGFLIGGSASLDPSKYDLLVLYLPKNFEGEIEILSKRISVKTFDLGCLIWEPEVEENTWNIREDKKLYKEKVQVVNEKPRIWYRGSFPSL